MDYHIVSVPTQNFRGRKKLPGRLHWDPSQNKLGVFIGYCSCHNKIITDQKTINLISRNYKKSNKKVAARLLLSAAKRFE